MSAEIAFNLVMVGAFYSGICGYLMHIVHLSSRGKIWLQIKIIALAVGWCAFLAYGAIRPLR